jgi:hypothetical protein
MTELNPDKSKDKVIHKPNKKSTIAACYDKEGHRCEICLEFSHQFVEVKSPFFVSIKFCDKCVEVMGKLLAYELLDLS